MLLSKNAIVAGAFCFTASLTVGAQEMKTINPGDSVNVLWIGNSYTYFNDLPLLTQDIARENGIVLNNTLVLKGGEKLSGHLENPQLTEELKKGNWDFIIMQEFSSTPAYSTKYVAENIFPYAEAIDSIAHMYSPDAHTVLYMTWGHRNGNERQTPYPLDDTYEAMQDRIATTYIDLTHELDAWCAPVGLAWKIVREENPAIDLYNPDNFHPSLAGSWLAANTMFYTLSRMPFTAIPPEGISKEENRIIHDAAIKAVDDNIKILNLPK